MGGLIISTQMTLDGVIDVDEWYVADGGHDRAGKDQVGQASAVLLGRKTYEGLAAYWSRHRIGCDSWGQRPSIRA
jgi:dihydrofolate reductase